MRSKVSNIKITKRQIHAQGGITLLAVIFLINPNIEYELSRTTENQATKQEAKNNTKHAPMQDQLNRNIHTNLYDMRMMYIYR